MNIICITGRLTASPDHRPASKEDGTRAYAAFRLAIDEPGSANDHNTCSFITVVCFGPMADSVHTHLDKGSAVGVQGRIQQREWTNADDQRRSTHRVIAARVEFLDRGPGAPTPRTGRPAVTSAPGTVA